MTWTQFPSTPSGTRNPYDYGFGDIAVGDTNHIVWVGAPNKWPYYTADRGASWHPVTIAGLNPATADLQGFSFAIYLHRHTLAADKATPNTFYLLYSGSDAATRGIYRSTDGGANWTKTYGAPNSSSPFFGELLFSSFNAELAAVPGKAGHLFLTSGVSGGMPDSLTPADQAFMRSTDGGATWTAVPNAHEVVKVGFGAPATVGGYPTIFVAGWVNGTWGLWRSTDNTATWTQIGTWPLDNLDQITTLTGDMNTFGKVYIGFGGSGAVYGQPAG